MPHTKRRLRDRIQDRLWREVRTRMSQPLSGSEAADGEGGHSSVSSKMPWVGACGALADGKLGSRNFRRLGAVTQIVETVGITEARFYLRKIREWGSGWLDHPKVKAIDNWGNPIRCPRLVLGTSRAFSPTTLRYLATALWLQRSGKLAAGSEITEIGVGFGGLAAMNALVSGASTTLVDLPQVEQAALRMLSENGLAGSASRSDPSGASGSHLVISNYAFTELSAPLQDEYFERHLRHARHGVIVSNAGLFADSIGGRSDEDIVAWLRDSGIPAVIESDNELLTPIDALCRVSLIHW